MRMNDADVGGINGYLKIIYLFKINTSDIFWFC